MYVFIRQLCSSSVLPSSSSEARTRSQSTVKLFDFTRVIIPVLSNKLNHDCSVNLSGLPVSLSFYISALFIFSHFILTHFPPAPLSAPSLSVLWSNNLLIIGCKKYLLRDYARYKKLTGDGSQNLSASLMRPGDWKARSAEPGFLQQPCTEPNSAQGGGGGPSQPSQAHLSSAQLGSAWPWFV